MISATKQSLTNRQVRCAIYTRKSSEHGLQQEFNSLDAQRESCEAYALSQRQEGWVSLPEHYDDGGISGGHMDRPALKRLKADIAAGKIDKILVYKLDRLSRSLRDFLELMAFVEQHSVGLVSVTQAFDTSSSMGRLMLNILLSFAQFEREMISERTRDKMSAARRKGQWLGGTPVLGYDVVGTKLVVNETEAEWVRQTFALYLKLHGLIPVVQELDRRGCQNKRWTTKDGRARGGQAFTKTSLHRLLTNVTYIGQVKYEKAIYQGQHQAIVDAETFAQVQALLARNGSTGGVQVRNRFGALLKGILRCTPCECAMTPSHATKGKLRYRYYICSNGQKRGRQACPSTSLPAHEIEQLVVDHIKCIGRDPALVHETLLAASSQCEAEQVELERELKIHARDLSVWNSDVHKLLGQVHGAGADSAAVARLAELQDRIAATEQRMADIQDQIAAIRNTKLDPQQAARALASFDPVWEALTPREQAELLHLLVAQVKYDGRDGQVRITLHPTGIRTLAEKQLENIA